MVLDEKEEPFLFEITIDNFHVSILFSLDKSDGIRAPNEKYTTYSSNFAKIRVSREEDEAIPLYEDKKYPHYFADRTDIYAQAAINVLNKLLRFFKYKLGNPSLHDVSLNNHAGFDNPEWEDCNGTKIDPGFNTNSGSRAGGITYYNFLGIKSYNKNVHGTSLQQALRILHEPELFEEILSDARTAIVQDNYRRAILEMAIACEIYVKQFFFSTSELSSAVFDYLEEKRKIEVGVMDLIHNISKYAFGESFKDIKKKDYRNIDYLFRARNKIAHQGQCFYKDDKGIKKDIYDDTLKAWWESINSLLSWLSSKKNL